MQCELCIATGNLQNPLEIFQNSDLLFISFMEEDISQSSGFSEVVYNVIKSFISFDAENLGNEIFGDKHDPPTY